MLAVPKGIWLQVGYNNLYGASGGLGINITPEVSMEYSYEKADTLWVKPQPIPISILNIVSLDSIGKVAIQIQET